MKDLSKEFVKAWEKHTGLEWSIDYQGGFRDSYRDFKAGWDAAAKLYASQPGIEADGEEQAAYDADCDHYNKYGWSPSH
uniref:Uncharacterized protein n=1 Tax=viral metagenome TaxID=1070528 RepID=A0A6H2A5S2_9ZZZZ